MFKFSVWLLLSTILFSPALIAEETARIKPGCLIHYLNNESNRALPKAKDTPIFHSQMKVSSNSLEGVVKFGWIGAGNRYRRKFHKNTTALVVSYDEKGINQYQLLYKTFY